MQDGGEMAVTSPTATTGDGEISDSGVVVSVKIEAYLETPSPLGQASNAAAPAGDRSTESKVWKTTHGTQLWAVLVMATWSW